MLLLKTDKARVELRSGVRTLDQRERSVLLLADGNRSMDDFRELFHGHGARIAAKLIADGYLLQSVQGADAQPVPAQPQVVTNALTSQSAPVNADSFEGKRSLATTRMFLFDLCERMFARRDPDLAEVLRESLRQAKDRESMLAAGRQMVAEIERIAGAERADSISQRIAMLLPLQAA